MSNCTPAATMGFVACLFLLAICVASGFIAIAFREWMDRH